MIRFLFFSLLFFSGSEFLSAQDIIIPFRENNEWYYVDVHKKRISSIVYQEAYPFGKKLAVVKLNGKYGFINKNEEIVIPCQYDFASSEFSQLQVAVGLDTFWIDHNGKRSSKTYNDVVSFSKSRNTKSFFKHGKNGVVNIYSDTILPAKYDQIEIIYYGAIIAWNEDGKIGIFDYLGHTTIPFELDSFRLNDNYNPKFIYIFSKNKVGAVDLKGNLIGLPKYEYIEYDNGLIFTILKNGKKGYLFQGKEYWSDKK